MLATRIGRLLGMSAEEPAEIYDQLRYISCNAETHAMAALFGDEVDFRRDYAHRSETASELDLVFGYLLLYIII